MGRPKNPQRGVCLKKYLESGGEITTAQLAEEAGVPASRIRKWKSEDKWDEQLKKVPRKRGGQKGNKNAAGRTPKKQGNRNAVTHGAYAHVGYEDISTEAAEQIKNLAAAGAMSNLLQELQALMVRKEYLEGLLKQYTDEENQQQFYTDKVVHMIVPKSVEDMQAEEDSGRETGEAQDPEATGQAAGAGGEKFKTAMKSVIKSSAFERAMKVESELNKVHGRILKVLDSIKAYEIEERRLTLQQQQYELQRSKALGEFDVDLEEDEDEQRDEP